MTAPYNAAATGGGEALSDDDDGTIDITELPNEYKIKLNGFLRTACQDGHETLTRVLLEKGADVNYVSPAARAPTALHVAILNSRDKVVPLLLPQANEATIQSALKFAHDLHIKLGSIVKLLQKDAPSSSTSTTTTTTTTTTSSEKSESENAVPVVIQPVAATTNSIEQTDIPSPSPSSSPLTESIITSPSSTPAVAAAITASLSNDNDEPAPLSPPTAAADLPKVEELLKKIDALSARVDKQDKKIEAKEVEITELLSLVATLEKEKEDLTAALATLRQQQERTNQETKDTIERLEKDIELKTKKIEKVSKERDAERRAKEIAKRLLSSDGPSAPSEGVGTSHAIRMGSVLTNSSPLNLGDDGSTIVDSSHPSPNGTSSVAINVPDDASSSTSTTTTTAGSSNNNNNNSSTDNNNNGATGKKLSAESSPSRPRGNSRAKDDMDIASEEERARVRRLVKRWEAMKFL